MQVQDAIPAEHAWLDIGMLIDAEQEERRRQQSEETSQRDALCRLERDIEDQHHHLHERKVALDEEYQIELERIESKITLVLKKKDEKLIAIRDEVDKLGKENQSMQRQLESLRDKAFA